MPFDEPIRNRSAGITTISGSRPPFLSVSMNDSPGCLKALGVGNVVVVSNIGFCNGAVGLISAGVFSSASSEFFARSFSRSTTMQPRHGLAATRFEFPDRIADPVE